MQKATFFPKLRIDLVISLGLLILLILLAPKAPNSIVSNSKAKTITLLSPAPVPVLKPEISATASATILNSITAQAVMVTDEDTHTILLQKNETIPLYPASTTKLMTVLVARDLYFLDDIVTVPEDFSQYGTVVGFAPGEMISIRNLIRAALISSGNDAAKLLGLHHPQGIASFVTDMNRKAKELGMTNSLFTNPSGLDSQSLVMSSRDLSLAAREAFKDPFLAEVLGTKGMIIADHSGQQTYTLYNTHDLIQTDKTVIGGKTGTTDKAGQVLTTRFSRDGHTIQVVVMGSEDRYTDTKHLIDWVMANYTWLEVR